MIMAPAGHGHRLEEGWGRVSDHAVAHLQGTAARHGGRGGGDKGGSQWRDWRGVWEIKPAGSGVAWVIPNESRCE